MSFQLTPEHAHSILHPASAGIWAPFVEALDPEVHWVIGSEEANPEAAIGVYNVASWIEKVKNPLMARLKGGLEMKTRSIDVIGNKCIAECYANSVQKNGRPYNQNYAWFLIFSEQTGKIVEIREYMNTSLVKEVLSTNPVE